VQTFHVFVLKTFHVFVKREASRQRHIARVQRAGELGSSVHLTIKIIHRFHSLRSRICTRKGSLLCGSVKIESIIIARCREL